MKTRKIMAMLLTVLMLIMAGCQKDGKTEAAEGNASGAAVMESKTVASTLYNEFVKAVETESDIEVLGQKLAESEVLNGVSMLSMPMEPGFLNGFDTEITGYKKAVVFAPAIGSIPFVGYIFETDDPAGLAETLRTHADLRWNICTEADEMVCEPVGNYVFFVMAPESFE